MTQIHYRGFGLAVAATFGFMCLAWGQSPDLTESPQAAPDPSGREMGREMTKQMGHHAGRHMGQPPGRQMIERMIWELDLSPEQEATIRDMMERESPRLRELHAVMREARQSIMDLDTADPEYAQTLAAASQTAGRTLTEIMQAHGQLRAEIQALLTQEQRDLARALRQKARDRMEAHLSRPFERPPAAFIF